MRKVLTSQKPVGVPLQDAITVDLGGMWLPDELPFGLSAETSSPAE